MVKKLIVLLFFLVPPSLLAQNFKVGELVEVKIEDVWFDAYIQEIDGKKIRLNYSMVSDETDFWVKEDELRPKGKSTGKKGDGQGSISFEHDAGSRPNETDKDKGKKDKAEEKITATTAKIITLHNTCSRPATFQIGEIRYEIERYQKFEIEINLGTSIYTIENGKKMIRGKVTSSITTFRPSCE
jgi:hypothetical protein